MVSEMIVTVTVSTISPLKPTHTDKDSSLSLTVYEVCSKLTDTSAKNYRIGYSLCICMIVQKLTITVQNDNSHGIVGNANICVQSSQREAE